MGQLVEELLLHIPITLDIPGVDFHEGLVRQKELVPLVRGSMKYEDMIQCHCAE